MTTAHHQRGTALFVTYAGHLDGGSGGVQLCTQEYLRTVQAAGIDCDVVKVNPDLSLKVRLRRKLMSSPYAIQPKLDEVEALLGKLREREPDYVFLNQVSLAPLAERLRRTAPKSFKIVLLSHGLESTDLLHLARLRREMPLSGSLSPSPAWVLGETIMTEARLRTDIDLVIALSPFDVVLEGWIGASRADWMPRIIAEDTLEWGPLLGRFGYLGTLDHAPNLEGIARVLENFSSNDNVEIRIVGGPTAVGAYLQKRFAHVTYLGPLDDVALRQEAASWQAFLHPIFSDARGCSTKLATALGWRLPILTTSRGARGYTWQEGALVFAEAPSDFAASCRSMDLATASRIRDDVIKVARSSPTLADNAALLLRLLPPAPANRLTV